MVFLHSNHDDQQWDASSLVDSDLLSSHPTGNVHHPLNGNDHSCQLSIQHLDVH
uniref:Uncharacterized protein n=1 Tax=Schistosoma japonicum TaxID=6182 RepID=Q5C396_SCHJA|nr:unknown [Schistosoma japonicum]AAX25879.1 unknown [Schistosoma japonicum]